MKMMQWFRLKSGDWLGHFLYVLSLPIMWLSTLSESHKRSWEPLMKRIELVRALWILMGLSAKIFIFAESYWWKRCEFQTPGAHSVLCLSMGPRECVVEKRVHALHPQSEIKTKCCVNHWVFTLAYVSICVPYFLSFVNKIITSVFKLCSKPCCRLTSLHCTFSYMCYKLFNSAELVVVNSYRCMPVVDKLLLCAWLRQCSCKEKKPTQYN